MKPVKYKISRLTSSIFVLQIKDHWDLAMTFMRCQEYYESGNKNFKGKNFDFWDYMKWYAVKHAKTDSFSYPRDWAAFNIPVKTIQECHNGITEYTPYDSVMFAVLLRISHLVDGPLDNIYLVGVHDLQDENLLHELSHAIWHTVPEYSKQSKKLIKALPEFIVDAAKDHLICKGYAKSVVEDEITAYFSTGDIAALLGKGYEEYAEPFKELLRQHLPKKLSKFLK